jgi:hypothetical protein
MGGWSGWSQISVGQADPAGDRIKKAVKPGLRRKLGQWAQQTYQIGQRRVARLMRLGWSSWLYRKKVRRFDEVLRRRLCEMATTHLRYGCRRLTVLLRREGWKVNAKRHLPAVHSLSNDRSCNMGVPGESRNYAFDKPTGLNVPSMSWERGQSAAQLRTFHTCFIVVL